MGRSRQREDLRSALRPGAAGFAGLVAACGLAGALSVGCGASEPRESDIYHDPLLRPSALPAAGEDAALLAELEGLETAGTLTSRGASVAVEAPYAAASGRVCRAVGERLACRSEDGWEFVPAVLPTADGPDGRTAP